MTTIGMKAESRSGTTMNDVQPTSKELVAEMVDIAEALRTTNALRGNQLAGLSHRVRSEFERLTRNLGEVAAAYVLRQLGAPSRPFTPDEAKAYRAFIDEYFDTGSASEPPAARVGTITDERLAHLIEMHLESFDQDPDADSEDERGIRLALMELRDRRAALPPGVDRLAEAQCDEIIAALETYEFTGFSHDDIRLIAGTIETYSTATK